MDAPGEILVQEIMRTDRPVVGPEQTLAVAGALMNRAVTRELAVVEGEILVGIITRSDMEPFRGHYEWTSVRAAMTVDPLVLAPDTTISAAARTFLAAGFNGIPVASGGRLLGMIARSDLLRILARPT